MTTLRKARYHHGDLRNALLDAAIGLAEGGGPDAVTIRGAAKSVGVTPTAAYRHFTGHDELVEAIQARAMATLSEAMSSRVARLQPDPDPAFAAVQHLATLGHGYVEFGLTHHGLFDTAFCRGAGRPEPDDPDAGPFRMLERAVDRLVEVGYLLPGSRPLAELAAWVTVHGLATMLAGGILGGLTDEEQAALVDRTLVMVARGLGDGPAAASVDVVAAVGRSVR